MLLSGCWAHAAHVIYPMANACYIAHDDGPYGPYCWPAASPPVAINSWHQCLNDGCGVAVSWWLGDVSDKTEADAFDLSPASHPFENGVGASHCLGRHFKREVEPKSSVWLLSGNYIRFKLPMWVSASILVVWASTACACSHQSRFVGVLTLHCASRHWCAWFID